MEPTPTTALDLDAVEAELAQIEAALDHLDGDPDEPGSTATDGPGGALAGPGDGS